MPNFLQAFFERTREKQDLKEALEQLVAESNLTPKYVLYTLISALLATLGIAMNNMPVLIGSMLVAPFLIPILSLAVGIGSGSFKLIGHSLKSLGVGLGLAFLAAITLTLYMGPIHVQPAIYESFAQRDLYAMVAVLSGILATYSWFSASKTLVIPGVAIAVSLVPPLALSGMLLPLRELDHLISTLQLLLINGLGIFFGAFITFLLIRFLLNQPNESVDKEVEKGVEKNSH